MHVSVSKVDAYLYWRGSDQKTLDELRNDLMGKTMVNDYMIVGRLFHSILGNARPGVAIETMEVEGWTFHFPNEIVVPVRGLHEVPGRGEYEVDGQRVTVGARCDVLVGNEVIDYKMITRWDERAYVRFQDSFQWRAYLSIFGAERFRYHLFNRQIRDRTVTISDHHELIFTRYPRLESDVVRTLREFFEFTRQYVPEFYEQQVEGKS